MSAAGSAPTRPIDARGFTLFEALVALTIMSLAAGIGFPAVQRLYAHKAMAEGKAAVTLALVEARAAAVRGDAPASVTLSDDRRSLRLASRTMSALPAALQIELTGPTCTFLPDGSSNGCTVTLSGDGATARIAVDPATSRIVEGQ